MSYLSLGDGNEEEADFFGSPVGGTSNSRLGSLFGMSAEMDKSPGSNQSLTYTAPKPPKQGKLKAADIEEKKPGLGQSSPSVAVAAAVTAYRYVNNQYLKQGKLGAALLSNFADKDYKILLYVSKQQPVTTAKITSDFQFNIQPNNYSSFYDDRRQMWSVMFDNSEQLVGFAKQICLAKFVCANDQNGITSQDLIFGEDGAQAIDSGDSVEVKYTGWFVLEQNGTLGSVFDTNQNSDKMFRFKAGKGKVIKGWDQGMIGMKKGGKRFLIIPPHLAYGSKGAGNKIPPNSTLAFEIDVLRTKHSKEAIIPESNQSLPVLAQKPEQSFSISAAMPFSGMPSDVNNSAEQQNDELVKTRTSSINEQMTNMNNLGDHNKANIVSRMAKMGVPMLPNHAPSPSISTGNPRGAETNSPLATAGPNNPSASNGQLPGQNDSRTPMILQSQHQSFSPSPVLSGVIEQPYMHNPHVTLHAGMMPHAASSINPYTTMVTTPFVNNIPGYQPSFNSSRQYSMTAPEILPVILNETRHQSSELKLILEKMDKVSEKVDEVKKRDVQSQFSTGETMDGAILAHNLQRIIQENDRMRKQLLEKNKQIESQNDKIAEILQKNQKYVEESHSMMEKRNVSFKETFGQSQERTLQLEQDKLELTRKLSDSTSKICSLHLQVSEVTERAKLLEKMVQETSNETKSKNEGAFQRCAILETELSLTKTELEEEKGKRQKLIESAQNTSGQQHTMNEKLNALKEEWNREKKEHAVQHEELKAKHAQEMENLNSKNAEYSVQLKEMSEEFESKWKAKCKAAVAVVTKAAEEKLAEAEKAKEQLDSKLEIIQNKFVQLRAMYEEKTNNDAELKERLKEGEVVMQKYENLRKQATAMKGKYENKIRELQEKLASAPSTATSDVVAEVKGIMNSVFQQIRAQVNSDEEYTGSRLLTIVLNIIKASTLKLLSQEDDESEDEEESDEETEADEQDDNNEDIAEVVDDVNMQQQKDGAIEQDGINAEAEMPPGSENDTTVEKSGSDDIPCTVDDVTDSLLADGDKEAGDKGKTAEYVHGEEYKKSAEKNPDEIEEETNSIKNEIGNFNESVHGDTEVQSSEEPARNTPSPSDAKPKPPPLFDNDESDEDQDWFK